jgi:hypothetical protein
VVKSWPPSGVRENIGSAEWRITSPHGGLLSQNKGIYGMILTCTRVDNFMFGAGALYLR